MSLSLSASQAVLGQFPNPPAELLISIEADLFTARGAEDSDLIDGTIGEGSPFHRTFGYYAHGVGAETAVLPMDWRDRVVSIRNENTGSGTALCLEVHDLAVSKLVAGREKDLDFVGGLLRHQLAKPETIRDRLQATPIQADRLQACLARLNRLNK